MKITVTEGLVKLKTLSARITKQITDSTFVIAGIAGAIPIGYDSVNTFNKKATEGLQSIFDLIENRDEIKSKIVESNAITNVTINNVTMKVSAAIEKKASIDFQQSLINKLKNGFAINKSVIENKNKESQVRLDRLIEASLGKDAVKNNPDDVKTISDNFWINNKYELLDPVSSLKIIETLEKNLNGFIDNLDVALSVSNATTFIELKD